MFRVRTIHEFQIVSFRVVSVQCFGNYKCIINNFTTKNTDRSRKRMNFKKLFMIKKLILKWQKALFSLHKILLALKINDLLAYFKVNMIVAVSKRYKNANLYPNTIYFSSNRVEDVVAVFCWRPETCSQQMSATYE